MVLQVRGGGIARKITAAFSYPPCPELVLILGGICHPCFMNETATAQRGQVTYPTSHR